jgi:ATP-dependent Lhr-like helicase
VEKYSWGGHLGIKMLPKILPIIEQSESTLVFTNTRSQCEIWYQQLLEAAPDLSGQMALHHGSLSDKNRKWVEDNLHTGLLKVVVATSSLDLGVDFNPVDTVIQIGSPKGIARLLQRAGRSGHRPGAISKLYYVPTNSLDIIDGAAIKQAIANNILEQRIPYVQSFDVLIQYMVTLAVSEGFEAAQLFEAIQNTHCFQYINAEEFQWCLNFITAGGQTLEAYDEFHKVIIEDGIYKVVDRSVAMRHRLSMGTIVSGGMMQVKFYSGKRLGSIEEYFISRLNVGDVFWFAGKNLEIHSIKNMDVLVKKSSAKNGIIPSWMGGRMNLSSQLSACIRDQIDLFTTGLTPHYEMESLIPLFQIQEINSHVPNKQELLIEQLETKDGFHIFIYPLEGRYVHEGMAAILSHRIGLLKPISFSIAMNDFGFELLSDTKVDMDEVLDNNLFSEEHLYDDSIQSMNATEMARRKFRDIASIAGLIFNGFPGKAAKTKHVQANAQLFFNVFESYEKDNLLLKQAYQEVMDFQLEIERMQQAFKRIQTQKIIVKALDRPSPFCFPMLVERLREKFSNESVEDRIQKMIKAIEK